MGRDGRGPLDADVKPESALFAQLPPEGTMRWMPRRKAQVVAAVRGGVLTLDDACKRYALTVEEFLTWQRAIDKYGLAGLRATHAQEHRASF